MPRATTIASTTDIAYLVVADVPHLHAFSACWPLGEPPAHTPSPRSPALTGGVKTAQTQAANATRPAPKTSNINSKTPGRTNAPADTTKALVGVKNRPLDGRAEPSAIENPSQYGQSSEATTPGV